MPAGSNKHEANCPGEEPLAVQPGAEAKKEPAACRKGQLRTVTLLFYSNSLAKELTLRDQH